MPPFLTSYILQSLNSMIYYASILYVVPVVLLTQTAPDIL